MYGEYCISHRAFIVHTSILVSGVTYGRWQSRQEEEEVKMFRGLLSPIFLVVLTDTLRVTESTLHVGNGNLSRCYDDATSIHTFTPVDIDNEPVKLSDYEGKVLLIVNVASFCTFTSQYHDLTKLKKMTDLEDKFEVLAFPCNQFGYQEPGENKYEIMNCLKYARPGYGYAPNFPIFSKIEVNGKDEIGLFTHLKVNHITHTYSAM